MNLKKFIYNKFLKKRYIKNYFKSNHRKKLLLVYVIDAFSMDQKSKAFRTHTNRWRNIAIAQAFDRAGYTVDIINFSDLDTAKTVKGSYDVILGLGDAFDYLVTKKTNQFGEKIYLGTGTYWEYQNAQEAKRIEEINKKYDADLKPNRVTQNDPEMWKNIDMMFLLGSEHVESTYRNIYKGKIYCFKNHGYDWIDFYNADKDFSKAKYRFLYISGVGFALNGLDLILEAFAKHPDWHLDVYGPVEGEPEFSKIFSKYLYETPNIHVKGWIDVCGDDFREVISNTGSIINALSIHAAETHGTIIVEMTHGLIPIAPQAGKTVLSELGIIIKNLTVKGVEESVESYLSHDEAWYKEKSRKVYEYSREHFSQKAFVQRFDNIIKESGL